MTPRPDETRWVPMTGLQADILARLAELLVTKDVPDGIVALVGAIPALWDEDRFAVEGEWL